MKVRSRDGNEVRRILAGMVLDQTVLSRIAGQWRDGGLFDAPWANLVGGWAVEHLQRYGEPPNGKLRTLYERWASTTKAPEETIRGVERFLQAADEENSGERINSDFLLDAAGRHFNSVRLKRAIQQAEESNDLGRVEQAYGELAQLSKVELGGSSVVRVAEDWDAWRQAFDQTRQEPLVHYPGGMQNFIGRWMVRDTLISFMAPDKSGKSVYLLDLAYRAVRNRNRVVYFDCGDNSQDQVMRRLGARAARMPSAENYKPVIQVPVGFDDEGNVLTEDRKFDAPVTDRAAYNAIRKACRGVDRLRVVCRPNSSVSVQDLESTLADWYRESGWTPDVVVADYADILAPPLGVRETLDQIDETWKRLRRLSQERHCLVVTATQSSAAAYSEKAKVLRKQHFSGRKTKLAHVNGMIGVNVGEGDRKAGVTRLNWIVRREGSYSESQQMRVAGCWAFYDPVIRVG